MSKQYRILVRVTRDEREWVKHAARLRGLESADYIKRAINAALQRDGVDAVLLKERWRETE